MMAAGQKLPEEIVEFMAKIGPRALSEEEARALNLLRLKHGLPAASASGVAAHILDGKDKS
ncbi:MAG: hypothetical protein H3C49_08515 [Alphaproteobacteria bacterium]|nr:hypothetical protein [Alphaproteobacteria bacterium]HCS23866.1 hypothetical protein [Rhodospirillaceae bacterium]HRI76267.1 hypothetical protein [Alphaproteobacteria bacterium]